MFWCPVLKKITAVGVRGQMMGITMSPMMISAVRSLESKTMNKEQNKFTVLCVLENMLRSIVLISLIPSRTSSTMFVIIMLPRQIMSSETTMTGVIITTKMRGLKSMIVTSATIVKEGMIGTTRHQIIKSQWSIQHQSTLPGEIMFLNNQVYNLLALLKRIKTLATNSKRLITLKIIMPMITELIKIYATCQILTKTVIIATTD